MRLSACEVIFKVVKDGFNQSILPSSTLLLVSLLNKLNCMNPPHPQAAGFILFCAQSGKRWPALYDEMCRVAGQGLYQGLGYKELKELGLSFSLNHVDETINMVEATIGLEIGNEPLDSHQNPEL